MRGEGGSEGARYGDHGESERQVEREGGSGVRRSQGERVVGMEL